MPQLLKSNATELPVYLGRELNVQQEQCRDSKYVTEQLRWFGETAVDRAPEDPFEKLMLGCV